MSCYTLPERFRLTRLPYCCSNEQTLFAVFHEQVIKYSNSTSGLSSSPILFKIADVDSQLIPEAHQLPTRSYSNQSLRIGREQCATFLEPFALPDKIVQLHLSRGQLRKEPVTREHFGCESFYRTSDAILTAHRTHLSKRTGTSTFLLTGYGFSMRTISSYGTGTYCTRHAEYDTKSKFENRSITMRYIPRILRFAW